MRTIRNCSVCVVGGAGFLGSHLTNHLIEDRGCEVLVIDNLVAGRREFVHPKAKFEHHDITGSEEYLKYLFIKHKVQFVGNWVAYPYIPVSYARPLHVCNVNFFGAMKVINAAQEAGCKGVLQVSSAEIYGSGQFGTNNHENYVSGKVGYKLDESAKVEPHSSYGVAKAAIDNWIQCRWKEAKTPCIALRQFNCVGERETHPYVIPEIISQLDKQLTWRLYEKGGNLNYEKVGYVKLGNNSFRDFMYAGDAVRIAVELLERGSFGEVYNLGSESGIKIYDLAVMIGKLMGFAYVKVEQDPARIRPWEIWHLQSCNDKIRKVVGKHLSLGVFDWGGIVSLEESLRRTIADYEKTGRRWCWEK